MSHPLANSCCFFFFSFFLRVWCHVAGLKNSFFSGMIGRSKKVSTRRRVLQRQPLAFSKESGVISHVIKRRIALAILTAKMRASVSLTTLLNQIEPGCHNPQKLVSAHPRTGTVSGGGGRGLFSLLFNTWHGSSGVRALCLCNRIVVGPRNASS